MNSTTSVRRFVAALLAALLCLGLSAPAMAADEASVIKLVKTEGTVTVADGSGRQVKLENRDSVRLFSGYTVTTDLKSYAWISLDDTKAIKLDEDSAVEIRQSGKKLEVLCKKGSTFFNVTAPLKADETLNIRTATMITGIRGTVVWVDVQDNGITAQAVLGGHVISVITDPITGQNYSVPMQSGDLATMFVHFAQPLNDRRCSVSMDRAEKDDIPGYVIKEVANDPEMQNAIVAAGGLDLHDVTPQEADDQLKQDQIKNEEEAQKRDAAEREQGTENNPPSQDPVWGNQGTADNGNNTTGGGANGGASGTQPTTTPIPQKTVTVQFDTTGGSAVTSAKVVTGNKLTQPENPTRAGYHFEGWMNGTTAYDFSAPVNGSMTLTARWGKLDHVTGNNATCTEAGNSEYYSCTGCGKYFSDEACTTEIKADSWVIKAKGHEYGAPEYTWSNDNKSVTATRVCGHDSSHTETETVNTTSQTTAAKCEAAGQTVYTASFNNSAFTAQSKTVEIPATGHAYGDPSYTWSNDNKSVTATRVCGNDSSHTDTETVNTTSQTTAATCEAAGQTVYTASFTNTAFSTQSKTVEIPATGHAYGDPTYTWSNDNSSVTATRVCGHNSSHTETETVNTESQTTAATCEAAGQTVYTASFNNSAFSTQSKTVEIPALGHTPVKTEAKAATCTEAGNSEYYSCSVCEKHFSDEACTAEIASGAWVIDALGHDWGEVEYTWANDYSSVTATGTCARDSSHTVTETKPTSYTNTSDSRVFTSEAFSNSAFAVQTKTVPLYSVAFFKNVQTEFTESELVLENSKISRPETDPTREGCVFGGWYVMDESAGWEDTSLGELLSEWDLNNGDQYMRPWNFDSDTVTETTSLYAKFTRPRHVISLDTEEGFTVSVAVYGRPVAGPDMEAPEEADVTVTVTAPEGNGFTEHASCSFSYGNDEWVDAETVSSSLETAVFTFKMPDQDVTVHAGGDTDPVHTLSIQTIQPAQPQSPFTVTMKGNVFGEEGMDVTNLGSVKLLYDRYVTAVITTEGNYEPRVFLNGESLEIADSQFTFTLTADSSLVITGRPFSITIGEVANGTLTAYANNEAVTEANAGDRVKFIYYAAEDGYEIKSITYTAENGGDPQPILEPEPSAPPTLTMPSADIAVSAVTAKMFMVSVDWDSQKGTVNLSIPADRCRVKPDYCLSYLVEVGAPVTMSAAPAEGYTLGAISGPDDLVLNENSFVMPEAGVWMYVNFDPMITVISPENGTVAVYDEDGSPVNGSAPVETTLRLEVQPQEGYRVESVSYTADGQVHALSLDDLTFSMPDSPITIQAVFVPIQYQITGTGAVSDGYGTLTAYVGGQEVTSAAAGTEVTLTYTPNNADGQEHLLSGITVQGATTTQNLSPSGTPASATFTMPAEDVNISASFA